MTGGLPKVNPFYVPQCQKPATLCPWQESVHTDYYVDVDNRARVVDDFISVMSDLTTLQRLGQVVLVTGGEGCGKTATVNWCAHHALTRMTAEKMAPEVIDLTYTFDGETEVLAIEARRRMVSDLLVTELLVRGLLLADQRATLKDDREHLRRVLPTVPGSLDPETAKSLIIILPAAEIPEEIAHYTSLVRGRTLLLVESPFLDNRVRDACKRLPPVVLNVGKLEPDDAQRFIADRFTRCAPVGVHPRMSPETIERAARELTTIGRLHDTLYGTYEWLLASNRPYSKESVVNYEDIRQYMFNELGTANR